MRFNFAINPYVGSVSYLGELPIEQMVNNIQIFSFLFPIRYYFKIYANQALMGAPIQYSIVYFIAMIVFLVLPFFVFMRLKSGAIKQNYPIK